MERNTRKKGGNIHCIIGFRRESSSFRPTYD